MKQYTLTLISGMLTLFACLGLGRFAFGMILPDLQLDLALNVTQSGFIGTSNFIGYFSGLLFSGAFYAKFGAKKLIVRSLFTQGLFMLFMALSSNYLVLSLFYFFAGLFGALSNMAIMAYITQIVPKSIRGKAAGFLLSGGGLAIVLSGYLVPYIETFYAAKSWKITWIIFSLLAIMIAIFVNFTLKKVPLHVKIEHNKTEHVLQILKDKRFIQIGGLYFCFGITYVVYVTFFVLASIDKWHISSDLSAPFWILLGFLSMFSGPLFGMVSDKIGRIKTINIVFFIQSIANIIMALDVSSSYLWISASLFGLSVWAIPSIMAVLTAETFGVEKTAQIFSKITIVFAIGQIIGPIGAGYLTDLTQDFSYAFGLSFVMTFLAFLGSLSIILKNKNLI